MKLDELISVMPEQKIAIVDMFNITIARFENGTDCEPVIEIPEWVYALDVVEAKGSDYNAMTVFVRANIEAEYQSEERAQMDGYQKAYGNVWYLEREYLTMPGTKTIHFAKIGGFR